MTRKEAVSTALTQKRKAASAQNAKREAQMEQMIKANPEYTAVCERIKTLGAKLALTAISGKAEELAKLKEELDLLSKKKADILQKSKIEENAFDCAKCRDTGYFGGEICDCVKTAAADLMLDDLCKKAPVKQSSFDSFDLSFYDDEKAKKRMSGIFDLAFSYSAAFSKDTKENLLFMGDAGLGKTHLSLSIAKEVIKKGFDVIYDPAYNLLSRIENEHFSLHLNDTYESAVSCDLLIIDDLGGEFVSPYIQSVVYNIINTRLNASRPTIINTNLSMSEIDERYTSRVASRLIGEYTAKAFLGKDVRQIKKKKV